MKTIIKTIIIAVLVCSLLVLISCSKDAAPVVPLTPPSDSVVASNQSSTTPEPIISEEVEDLQNKEKSTQNITCERNDQCEQGVYCLNKKCARLSQINNATNCKQTCRLSKAYFHTSDNEEYTLSQGQGTYTAAGALEWKLMSFPEYCQGEQPQVPLLLLKKNAGKVLEETAITLKQGDTSNIVTHPTVKRVQFTITLSAVEESCK
ncbi:hypothetical protein HYV86_06830 [Candidatus Woesearchaeota archaeon]|nr:hypothetical protein [Candidatus Woesearchaeota archaeon]